MARVLINIDVYCIVTKYGLDQLKDKAVEKCMAQSWSTWTFEELSVLIRKVYCSVSRNCKALRRNLVRACADHVPGFFVKDDGTCSIENAGEKISSRRPPGNRRRRQEKVPVCSPTKLDLRPVVPPIRVAQPSAGQKFTVSLDGHRAWRSCRAVPIKARRESIAG